MSNKDENEDKLPELFDIVWLDESNFIKKLDARINSEEFKNLADYTLLLSYATCAKTTGYNKMYDELKLNKKNECGDTILDDLTWDKLLNKIFNGSCEFKEPTIQISHKDESEVGGEGGGGGGKEDEISKILYGTPIIYRNKDYVIILYNKNGTFTITPKTNFKLSEGVLDTKHNVESVESEDFQIINNTPGGGGGNAPIVHTLHKISGDGNCFYSSVYTCLENANLLHKLNPCFTSYNPSIVLDTRLEKKLQYIKALREMCTKSEEYKQNLEGLYKGFFVDDEFVMTNNILNGVSSEQLNALGFKLHDNGTNDETPISFGSMSVIDLLTNRNIAIINYEINMKNMIKKFSKLDSKSINTIIGKQNDTGRKTRYIRGIQKLSEKTWATQVEVLFLTKKLKECGQISIDVKHAKISKPQPIIDSKGNQIIYVLNEDQTHYDAYLRNASSLPPSAKSGGGGGAEMPSDTWSCENCKTKNSIKNNPFCKNCPKPLWGGSRRKRKSARKHKSRKTRTRRTKSRRH